METYTWAWYYGLTLLTTTVATRTSVRTHKEAFDMELKKYKHFFSKLFISVASLINMNFKFASADLYLTSIWIDYIWRLLEI